MLTDALSSWNSSDYALGIGLSYAVFLILSWITSPGKAPDLPGPKGWPIVGSLFQRGTDPADTYHQWSKIYGPVFRLRLGNRWAVVINSADAADELLSSAAYASTFQSRPISWSFGRLLEEATNKTITIGSSPYDDDLKTKRRLSIASVSPAAIKNYEHIFHESTRSFLTDLTNASKNGNAVDPWPIFIRNSAGLAISTYFGSSIQEAVDVLNDSPYSMKRLAQVRNINGRARDYLPFLRVLPEEKMFYEAVEVAKYRNAKLASMLNKCRQQFADGTSKPCGAVTMMNNFKKELTDESLTSVSNSMVSSGLEAHLPNTLLWSLGLLASNKEIQQKCYEAIIRRENIDQTIDPEKDRDDYLMAFVKECGRWFTTFRLSLARETIGKDCVWKDHYIPEGTMVWCNVHAMNRDETRFHLPDKFMPERYMSGPEAERTLPHYSFGTGRRMCPATILVHKEIYSIFQTILSCYSVSIFDGEHKFDPVKGCNDAWDFNQAPKPYRISLHIRDEKKLNEMLHAEDY
ncbi:cytochrome P450 [Crucibulum laeve]|uniref:Cytochrome P450 n=1 Tax=Crucibulum laeve TaxID=68775 RepID=A0A5C3M2J4_9AGAR|nr:cytochrome P450 [Crucibulum laeve]